MSAKSMQLPVWFLAVLSLALFALAGATLLASSNAAALPTGPRPQDTVTIKPAGHFGGWPAALAMSPSGAHLPTVDSQVDARPDRSRATPRQDPTGLRKTCQVCLTIVSISATAFSIGTPGRMGLAGATT